MIALAAGIDCHAAVVSSPQSGATYKISAKSYLYTGQKIPGSNRKADRDGWCVTPTGDSGHALVDGAVDWRHSVKTQFWSQQNKIIEVVFDLGKTRAVDRVEIALSTDHRQGSGIDRVTLHWGTETPRDGSSDDAMRFSRPVSENWNGALCFFPEPPASPGAAVRSPRIGQPARFVRVMCESRQAVMVIGEMVVHGEDVTAANSKATATKAAAPSLRFKPVAPLPAVTVGKLAPAYDWIVREKIRGMYGYVGGQKDKGMLDNIVGSGFNVMLVHTMSPAIMSEAGWRREANEWAAVQKERRLRIIISWPYGSDERYGNTQFGAYHPGTAKRWTRTPCPMSKEYWDRVIGDRAVVAAQAGLTGLVVDPEMYGADSTGYQGPCYCDRCWGQYVRRQIEGLDAASIPAPERAAWTARHVVSADYQRWQEATVVAMLRELRARVHQVSPDFLLGNLAGIEFSIPGLAMGLGTPEMPALIFGEREYKGRDASGWFNVSALPERVENLRKRYPALYVTGLWPQFVAPPELSKLVQTLGAPYAGYWIWGTSSFQPNASGDNALHAGFTRDDYWKAFAKANRELGAPCEPLK